MSGPSSPAPDWHPWKSPWNGAVQAYVYVVWGCLLGIALGMAIGVTHTPGVLVFSHDGKLIVGTVNGYQWPRLSEPCFLYGVVKVWDATTGKELARLAGPGTWLRDVAVSLDGSTLAVVGDTPVIELWDLHQHIRTGVLAGPSENVSQVSFAPDGARLAAASYDGAVRLWNVATRQTHLTIRVDEYGASNLVFSPDGKTLATCDGQGIRFWDSSDGHLISTIKGWNESSRQPRYGLGLLGFTADETDCILTRHEGRHGEVAAVLDGATQAERFAVRPWRRRCMKLSPDSRRIASGDGEGNVEILDAASGKVLFQNGSSQSAIRCLAFSPDGKHLAAGSEGGDIRVWETGSGKPRLSFTAGNPFRRWGPVVAVILIWGGTTMFLRMRSRHVRTRQIL